MEVGPLCLADRAQQPLCASWMGDASPLIPDAVTLARRVTYSRWANKTDTVPVFKAAVGGREGGGEGEVEGEGGGREGEKERQVPGKQATCCTKTLSWERAWCVW